MMGAVEQQVLPSQGEAPGRSSPPQAYRVGLPMQQTQGALSRLPSVAPGSGVSLATGFAILWAWSLGYPPTTELVTASAGRIPATYGEWGLASEHQGRGSDLLQESRPLVDAIRGLLTHQARVRGITVKDMTASRFLDPDETTEEIVVTQHVDLPADKALAYWDEVSVLVERWRLSLPRPDAEQVSRYISVDIKWSDAQSSSV